MILQLLFNRKLVHDYQAAVERRARPVAPEALDRTQLLAVQRAWQDATTDVPYYAGLVRDGLAPAVISSWDEFRRIPSLPRRALQDHPELFHRCSRRATDSCITAGSTGTPLKMEMDQGERDLMRIVKLAEWQRFGYRPDSRLFLIWGHAHLLGTGWRGRVKHVRRKLADRVVGYKRVDAYRMTPADCRRYARSLIRHRPLGVIGYASALDMFATHVADLRHEIRNLGIRFVMATAEPLPRPDSHALLAETFGCPVVQEYGGVEFGQVAFGVDHDPFDVYGDINYVEALPCQPDAPGDHPLLVTSLYSRYVPLFRYEVGDACQQPDVLPHGHVHRFARVAGRVNDQIVLADGAAVHSVSIFHCIHQEPTVVNIQMRLSDTDITILLAGREFAASAPARQEAAERIRARLDQVHPALGRARLVWTEDLGTNRAGKRRWFVDDRTGPTAPRSAPTHAST